MRNLVGKYHILYRKYYRTLLYDIVQMIITVLKKEYLRKKIKIKHNKRLLGN